MASRAILHSMIVDILGSTKVYYQAPENISLQYPCVIYNFVGMDIKHADNEVYNTRRRYEVIFITKDPDSDLIDEFLKLPFASFDRSYVYDNLHHYVYTIYY